MPAQPQPLDQHQQELVNITKTAHQTLALARQTRTSEYARRVALETARIKLDVERQIEEARAQIAMDLDAEVAVHESNLDEALIACYEAGIPNRRIAIDGFGNRYDGGVNALLTKLRTDGRIGNRIGYQRNTTDELDTETETLFPVPIDVEAILSTATSIGEPTYTLLPVPLELVPGDHEFDVPQVRLDMDPRDPWFKRIAKNAREGTPFRNATFCTLYLHPTTGELLCFESKEKGSVVWDHPVARYAKEHAEEVRNAVIAALESAE